MIDSSAAFTLLSVKAREITNAETDLSNDHVLADPKPNSSIQELDRDTRSAKNMTAFRADVTYSAKPAHYPNAQLWSNHPSHHLVQCDYVRFYTIANYWDERGVLHLMGKSSRNEPNR
ncbi:hypothetical protein J2Y63_006548 [Shinella sp. BE166]|uniref:hypothetical protein n=1 Tax=Shinella sp. BE166 TaxID=3373918 RepID=UPI003EC0ABB2